MRKDKNMNKNVRDDSLTLAEAAQKLRQHVDDAIRVLADEMYCSPSYGNRLDDRKVSVQAAAQILNSALEYSKYADLEKRIEALEKAQELKSNG